MVRDWAGNIFLTLTFAGCVILLITCAALIYQGIIHLRLRRASLAQEAKRLAQPLPPDAELPDVVLQIAVFNEGALVERSIDNAMSLDWPRNKLHVQICDDSTDGTTALANAAAQKARDAGFDVVVLHRDDRKGFKAGALQAAMNRTNFDYFAILDADFVTPRGFLRQCMTMLMSDAMLAFVQARPDFFNADANILTRAQIIILDYHHSMEQATRSWSHQALPFNGTCGIWRRAAIELGGGWRGETLTEDWELSFHARLNGMTGTFLNSVTASGELPLELRTWIPQQRRWGRGIGQVVWKMMPLMFGKQHYSAEDRFATVMPLAMWFMTSMFTATYLFAIAALLLKPSLGWLFALGVYAVYGFANGVLFVVMYIASRTAGRKLTFLQYFINYLPVPFLCLYVSWAQFWSMPATILGRQGVFVRTPKRGSSALFL